MLTVGKLKEILEKFEDYAIVECYSDYEDGSGEERLIIAGETVYRYEQWWKFSHDKKNYEWESKEEYS